MKLASITKHYEQKQKTARSIVVRRTYREFLADITFHTRQPEPEKSLAHYWTQTKDYFTRAYREAYETRNDPDPELDVDYHRTKLRLYREALKLLEYKQEVQKAQEEMAAGSALTARLAELAARKGKTH